MDALAIKTAMTILEGCACAVLDYRQARKAIAFDLHRGDRAAGTYTSSMLFYIALSVPSKNVAQTDLRKPKPAVLKMRPLLN
jgi:hypothetical protein